jgi:hypothetical protein
MASNDPWSRDVRDIDPVDREALEHVIGRRLREDQQAVINGVSVTRFAPTPAEPPDSAADVDIPEWWSVYEGLSDEEIDCLDQAIRKRTDLTRHVE